MILLRKRDQEVIIKDNKKNVEKTCTIFMKVDKWFLMLLKVKYS